MTNQEAIKWIDGRVLELSCLADISNTDKKMQRINEEYNALLQARAALEKRIPVAPDLNIANNDELWRKEIYSCVNCGKVLYIQNHIADPDGRGFRRFPNGARTYACPECGQVQNWERYLAKKFCH